MTTFTRLVLLAVGLAHGSLPALLCSPLLAQGESKPAASGLVAKVAPLAADALVQAKAWQADARLIGIFARARSDGRVDPKALMKPPNLQGCCLTFHAHSPSAGTTCTFVLEESGKLAESWLPGPSVPTAPILEKFLDLDAAIAKAIAAGFKLAPVEGKSYLDAWLTGATGVSDKMTGAKWTLISVDMSGSFPAPTDSMTIDAATDAQTTEEAKAGRTEREHLADELLRGKHFPESQRDWSVYRKEADAMATRWNVELRPVAIQADGEVFDGKLSLNYGSFRYFAPARNAVGWGNVSVCEAVTYSTGSGRILRFQKIQDARTAVDVHPVPADALLPDAAIARLRAVEPAVSNGPRVRLVSGDLLIEAAAQASKPLTSDEAALVRGRWLWLSEAYGVVNWSESRFTWQRSLSQTVAIDAVTGALVINNRVPADNPASREAR